MTPYLCTTEEIADELGVLECSCPSGCPGPLAPPCSCHGDAEGCASNCDSEFCGCARVAYLHDDPFAAAVAESDRVMRGTFLGANPTDGSKGTDPVQGEKLYSPKSPK